LKGELENLKLAEAKRVKQQASIDDAPTRDTLYEFYHQIEHDLYANDEERNRRFEGDADELWGLKQRVLRRIAGFDAVGKAIEEARSADVVT
jgi:hypothetical protein